MTMRIYEFLSRAQRALPCFTHTKDFAHFVRTRRLSPCFAHTPNASSFIPLLSFRHSGSNKRPRPRTFTRVHKCCVARIIGLNGTHATRTNATRAARARYARTGPFMRTPFFECATRTCPHRSAHHPHSSPLLACTCHYLRAQHVGAHRHGNQGRVRRSSNCVPPLPTSCAWLYAHEASH